MTRGPAGLADWPQSLGPGARRREALAWTGAALTVALVATATAALAMRLDDQLGREAESESVVYLDLTPEPPPPSAAALPDFAPETPMTELPDAPEPEEMAEPEPEVAPPPPDIRPPTDMAQLPDVALPPDSFSPEPPPPAPEPEPEPEPEVESEPEQAQIPDVRPRPRPERKPEPERKPREEPVKRAAQPTPRAASPASSTQSQGQAALPQGRLDDLAARWGNQIRSKIQRYARAPRGKRGSIVVRLEVARSGALMSAGIVRSSGDPSLDAAVVKAVQSARSFAAAPAQLPGASHSFSLPIDFQ